MRLLIILDISRFLHSLSFEKLIRVRLFDYAMSSLPFSSKFEIEVHPSQQIFQLHIEGLCHGNLSEEEVKAIADIFANAFLVQPLPMELRHQGRVLCLPSAAKLMRNVRVKNELEVNSVIEVIYFSFVVNYDLTYKNCLPPPPPLPPPLLSLLNHTLMLVVHLVIFDWIILQSMLYEGRCQIFSWKDSCTILNRPYLYKGPTLLPN